MNYASKKSKDELIAALRDVRDKSIPHQEAASQLKVNGKFDIELFKEVVLDESLQISLRQKAMFIGATSGEETFILLLARSFVLGKDPKLMIDNPKHGSFGMWADAKEICEQHGIKFK